jgi:hypothetical protein
MNTSSNNVSPTPSRQKSVLRWIAVASVLLTLQACAVLAVADAAVTVVATSVKITAKAVGAVADAVIPDDD